MRLVAKNDFRPRDFGQEQHFVDFAAAVGEFQEAGLETYENDSKASATEPHHRLNWSLKKGSILGNIAIALI